MTEAPRNEERAPPRPPQEMRLRAQRAPVTRLSRKVLLGLAGLVGLGIGGAAFLGLRPRPAPPAPELFSTSHRTTPEGLAALPPDYTARAKPPPRLGPPLPGDLGRPLVDAGVPGTLAAPDIDRLAQEQEAARVSRLFVAGSTSAPVAAIAASTPAAAPAAVAAAGAAPQDHKLAFLNRPADQRTVSKERLQPAASPYVLQAGSVIPAALITGLRSDLPGPVTAQVTEDVYDSVAGSILLIPQGARLIGQYDAQVAFGQSRALLVWTRLIMPNGRSIRLERQPGADTEGYAGLEDQVDNHWATLFKAAILSTILSVGSEAGMSANNYGSLADALQQGVSQSINQTGQQVVSRSLSVQPTITIRPGFPVRVMVTADLVLEPYRG